MWEFCFETKWNSYLHCVVGWWYEHSSPLLQTGQNLHLSSTFGFFKGRTSSITPASIMSSVSKRTGHKNHNCFIKNRPGTSGPNYAKLTSNSRRARLFTPHLQMRWRLPAVSDGCQFWAPSSYGGGHLWPSCVVWHRPTPSHSQRDSPVGWAPHLMWQWTWGWQSSLSPY